MYFYSKLKTYLMLKPAVISRIGENFPMDFMVPWMFLKILAKIYQLQIVEIIFPGSGRIINA